MDKNNNLESIISHLPCNVKIDKPIDNNILLIAKNCNKSKGLYTVLVTLLYYKYLYPNQDIRLFQTKFEGGFSARGFDTKFVTPILKKMGFPAMAESGWLTRSLEQPYPYDYNYKGALPPKLKKPFLDILQYVQDNPDTAFDLLVRLLSIVKNIIEEDKIIINPIDNKEKISISRIIDLLTIHFLTKYNTHGGAKLPVLAFYAIYSLIIPEIKRYSNCTLLPLSSLTACDKTNKTSGDIEVFKNNNLFEAIEIKLSKKIDSQIVRVVRDKIYKWNPQRYYILSVIGIEENDQEEIEDIIGQIFQNHGCQIIINGLLPTLKYYLRLIEDLNAFVNFYSKLVQNDKELQFEHKKKWKNLIMSTKK